MYIVKHALDVENIKTDCEQLDDIEFTCKCGYTLPAGILPKAFSRKKRKRRRNIPQILIVKLHTMVTLATICGKIMQRIL